MKSLCEQEQREKRDFNILFFSIVLFSCIMIFIMSRFWQLEPEYTAVLMLLLSLISFIPAAANVRFFRRIVILFMSAGALCGAAALFILLPSYMSI